MFVIFVKAETIPLSVFVVIHPNTEPDKIFNLPKHIQGEIAVPCVEMRPGPHLEDSFGLEAV
jgi:hypothetical protein